MSLEDLEEFWADIRPNRLPQPELKEPYTDIELMAKSAYQHVRKNPNHVLTYADDVARLAFGFACKTCCELHASTMGTVVRRGTQGEDIQVVPEFSWEVRAKDTRSLDFDSKAAGVLKNYLKDSAGRRALLGFFNKGHL
jgi:hypothetical protein